MSSEQSEFSYELPDDQFNDTSKALENPQIGGINPPPMLPKPTFTASCNLLLRQQNRWYALVVESVP
jgi:hypothetical protein